MDPEDRLGVERFFEKLKHDLGQFSLPRLKPVGVELANNGGVWIPKRC
jgi:hypothetical protein